MGVIKVHTAQMAAFAVKAILLIKKNPNIIQIQSKHSF